MRAPLLFLALSVCLKVSSFPSSLPLLLSVALFRCVSVMPRLFPTVLPLGRPNDHALFADVFYLPFLFFLSAVRLPSIAPGGHLDGGHFLTSLDDDKEGRKGREEMSGRKQRKTLSSTLQCDCKDKEGMDLREVSLLNLCCHLMSYVTSNQSHPVLLPK